MTRIRILATALLVGACGGDSQPPPASANPENDFGEPWLTEPEFEIGNGTGGSADADFSLISSVRVLGDGNRILVVEATTSRVTIWTPDGSLVREVGGPGDGPGEFAGAILAEVHRNGFSIRDFQRYSSFSNDGTLTGTTPYPPRRLSFRGFPLGAQALLHDGSFLAIPRVPPAVLTGFDGDEPIEYLPVYHVRAEGDDWTMKTIAMLDTRNRDMSIRPRGTPFEDRGLELGQPLGDFDLTWFDPDAGSAVVLRRNLGGGAVELLEIEASGDTLWRRRISPAPVPLGPDRVTAFVDETARRIAAAFEGAEAKAATVEAIADAMHEVVYVPDPLPGATRLHGSGSGEIWFQGYQTQDTLSLWYVIGRDGVQGRQVLLPPGFRAMDATDSHVWGIRRDDLGVQHVVGRRLVPPNGA